MCISEFLPVSLSFLSFLFLQDFGIFEVFFLAKTEYFYGADKKHFECLSNGVRLNTAVMETTLLATRRPEMGAGRPEKWDVV